MGRFGPSAFRPTVSFMPPVARMGRSNCGSFAVVPTGFGGSRKRGRSYDTLGKSLIILHVD